MATLEPYSVFVTVGFALTDCFIPVMGVKLGSATAKVEGWVSWVEG